MTIDAPRATAAESLDVAVDIAHKLCRTALTFERESTWLGTQQHGNGEEATSFSYATIAGDLYGGTSGIALFLAEVYARTGENAFKTTAATASEHALASVSGVPRRFRLGFYSGVVGVAYSLARTGRILAREDFVQRAHALLRRLVDDAEDDTLLDVISGAAGAVTPLLSLADVLGDSQLVTFANYLGDRIIAAAQKSEHGWSWNESATGFTTPRNLTGFAHGAAGMGWSLLELYARSNEQRYLDGAREAFRYENSVFVVEHDNWPDYRFANPREQRAPCGLAWCFGAPGIGLSRLRAFEIEPSAAYSANAEAAVRAVGRVLLETPNVGDNDFSLCHGWSGIAEFLLLAEKSLGDRDAGQLARGIAVDGAARQRATQTWHCGLLRGDNPSLMLGIAGIGHFYLRLADATVPSVLLVSPRALSNGPQPATNA